ncbi:MAG: response regulator transcription factor [Planctomycetota bacterium]
MNLSPVTIAIIDDHPLVQQGISAILSQQDGWEVCGVAATLQEAVALIERVQPAIAIVDLSLAGGSGMELVSSIVKHSPNTKSIVSSMHDELVYARLALQAGAMGYVHKQHPPEKLVQAINSVLQGNIVVSDEVTQQLIEDARNNESAKNPNEVLSKRELDVLRLIGQGCESKLIAEKLEVSQKTVDSYRERIKQKLDLPNATRLVHYATLWSQV